MNSRRTVPVLLVLALAATGCGFFGEGAQARDEAEKLATGLTKGDLGAVAFVSDKSRTAYAAQAAPLKGFDSKVSLDQVTRSGDTAKARLVWSTDLDGQTWKHTTSATLVKRGDAWQVEWKPSILAKGLGADETLRVARVKAERGDILGAGDQPIVVPRPVVRFGIDKAQAPAGTAADAARRLAALLDIDATSYATNVTKAGPKAFVEAIVLRRAQVSSDLLGRVAAIKGARGISDQLPLAPAKGFAAALLGTVGPVTAELVKKSEGRLRAGDDAGLSGLQRRYDEQLFGTPGIKVSAVPRTGEPEVLFEADPKPGEDLHLSLVPALQSKAEQLLDGVGPASAVVAIRPSTGEVLVAASGPGSKGYNTATFGRYAPGSTFKVVSALALLRSGLEPTATVPCTPSLTVNGKVFKNYSDYPANRLGTITLTEALANSCNTAFISQRGRIQGNALAQAAEALGVGKDYEVGYPSFFGQVPPPSSETERAADLIGQGKVLASPLAMAVVAASVVRGSTVVPTLVAGPDAEAPKAAPAAPLTGAEARQLRALMHAVVEQGSGAALADLQPPEVLAKTGTAEYGSASSGGGPLPTHTWMLGAQGDLAVAVFVATGESGSRTSGPILKAFLGAAR
ncbi:MAG: penicillin-binding protein [Nocardioidaceae bacterium]|nr:penicillin-binding protein [Nocardioidaceae bacterium]